MNEEQFSKFINEITNLNLRVRSDFQKMLKIKKKYISFCK